MSVPQDSDPTDAAERHSAARPTSKTTCLTRNAGAGLNTDTLHGDRINGVPCLLDSATCAARCMLVHVVR